MKITYIHHSCFSVEMDDIVLLFDYYKGNLPLYDKSKHIYVFSSHKHHDHFDLCIFALAEQYPHITFILSNDIRMNDAYMDRNNIPISARQEIVYIGKNTTAEYPIKNKNIDASSTIENSSITENLSTPTILQVETLASTDAGVAFIVSCGNKVIYHAGDLHWWTWESEPKEDNDDMELRFKNEMDKLDQREIDVAFVPLDPRLENRYWWGLDYYMQITQSKAVFPMHFWMDYTVIQKFKELDTTKDYSDRIMNIQDEGQTFEL